MYQFTNKIAYGNNNAHARENARTHEKCLSAMLNHLSQKWRSHNSNYVTSHFGNQRYENKKINIEKE